MKKIIYVFALALCAINSYAQCDQYPQPVIGQRVYDYYNKIDPADESYLQSLATLFEDSTGIQMAIITLRDLGGQDKFDYGQGLGNCWGVGEKGVDNGLLLIVSFEDRTARIHTGKKTEIYLTDATSGQLLDDVLVPNLQAGTPSKGIRETVDAIISHIGWDSWEEREAAKSLKIQQSRESITNFFSWLLQFILLCGAGFFSWLLFRNLAIKSRVRLKIKDLDNQISTSTMLFDVMTWPTWAKDKLTAFQKEYDEVYAIYTKDKASILETLKKKPKNAENRLPKLENEFQHLMDISKSASSITEEIELYKTTAAAEIKNSSQAIAVLKGKIESDIKAGFKFNSYLKVLDACLSMLGGRLEDIKNSTDANPDVFKDGSDVAKVLTQRANELKEKMEHILQNFTTINEEAPKQRERIQPLLDNKKTMDETMVLLHENYPASVYQGFETPYSSVANNLFNVDHNLETALFGNSLKVQQFDEAYKLYTDAVVVIDSVEKLYQSIDETLAIQKDAEKQFPSQRLITEAAFNKAVAKCEHSDVETHTRNLLTGIKAMYEDVIEKTSKKPTDWTKALELLKEAESYANSAYQKAEDDIDDARRERVRRREEAEADERRAALRREESYNSSSSSNTFSSGSSGRGYGGGGFGGGGAGRNW